LCPWCFDRKPNSKHQQDITRSSMFHDPRRIPVGNKVRPLPNHHFHRLDFWGIVRFEKATRWWIECLPQSKNKPRIIFQTANSEVCNPLVKIFVDTDIEDTFIVNLKQDYLLSECVFGVLQKVYYRKLLYHW
jgi:hypothetical protein